MANQTQNLAAILSNFDTALEATATAYDSAGSAARENDRYMESLQAKINNLKAAFQELIFGEGGIHDVISWGLDAVTALIKLADKIDGSVYVVGALTIAFGRLTKSIQVSILMAQMAGVQIPASLLKAQAAISALTPLILSALAAFATYKLVDYFEGEPERKAKKMRQNLEDINDEYDKTRDEYIELNKRADELSEAEQKRLNYLGQQLVILRNQQKEARKLALEAQKAAFVTYGTSEDKDMPEAGGYAARNPVAFLQRGQNNTRYSGATGIELVVEDLEELEEAYKKAKAAGGDYYKQQEDYFAFYGKNQQQIENTIAAYEDMIVAGDDLSDADIALYTSLRRVAEGYIGAGGSSNIFLTNLGNIHDYANENITVQDYLGKSIHKVGDQYYFVSEVAKETALAELNIEKTKTEGLRQEVQKRIDEYARENKAAFDAAVMNGTYARMYGASGAADLDKQLADIEKVIAKINGIGVRAPSGGGDTGDDPDGTGNQSDALKDLKEEFDDIIDVMEHKLELDKRNGASIQDQIKGYKDLQAEVHRQAEEYRKMGLDDNSEYIRALQKQWWDYQDDIDDLRKEEYEKQKEYNENLIDALKMYADEQKDALDDQIDALQEQLDLLDEQNDERERALELEEAEQALLNARKKKIKVYREGVGWVYEADPRKVQEAEDKLQEIKDKNAQEDEKKAIEDKIQALKDEQDAWDKAYDEYKKYNDKMELELKLNKSIEEALLDQKLDNWKDYKDALKKIADDIIGQQKAINAIENGDRSSGGAGSVPAGGYVKTQAEADSIRAEMAANSAAWHNASKSEKEKLHQRNLELGARLSATYNSSTGKWSFANGTKGMPETHLAMVGERGAELGVFPKGTGVIPHNLTENLMEIGKYSMSQLSKIFGNKSEGNIDKSSHININKVEVTSNNANNFVKQLQNFVPISK